VQLIALMGMTLAASAGLAELRYALLPSLSMLGAAESATGCSMRAQLIALVGMMLAASASLAELQYALLPSLSMLGAATGCSMRAQLIALVGMTLATSAGLAELQYALLPSLSVLGAATGCSMRAQLIALVGMTLAASAGLAELRYALLPSLSMLGAAEALFGGAPHDGAAAHAEMAAFSAANKDAAGKPRCFNFWASTSGLLPQPFLSFSSRVSGVVEIKRVSSLRSSRATEGRARVRFTRDEWFPSTYSLPSRMRKPRF
jgi:hypothetical protein